MHPGCALLFFFFVKVFFLVMDVDILFTLAACSVVKQSLSPLNYLLLGSMYSTHGYSFAATPRKKLPSCSLPDDAFWRRCCPTSGLLDVVGQLAQTVIGCSAHDRQRLWHVRVPFASFCLRAKYLNCVTSCRNMLNIFDFERHHTRRHVAHTTNGARS